MKLKVNGNEIEGTATEVALLLGMLKDTQPQSQSIPKAVVHKPYGPRHAKKFARWTDTDDAFLKSNYKLPGANESKSAHAKHNKLVAKHLGRTRIACYSRFYTLSNTAGHAAG